ncbi:MAG: hypothetical protein JWO95_2164 [Verrucomicrobiales bacterium]|nr:hypothetical protein [Verrucomicrobiales bacterium]
MSFVSRALKRWFFSSSSYWEKRYRDGGNSGAGSYNELAAYKADFINNFIRANGVTRLFDFGSGDGNQAGYLQVESYLGVDVSKTAVTMCRDKFKSDSKKRFVVYNPDTFKTEIAAYKPQLSISMDVLYHLVEDEVFTKYMTELFETAGEHVVIYASNFDSKDKSLHHRDRNFTPFVERTFPQWSLVKTETNPHRDKSIADFFVYTREQAAV